MKSNFANTLIVIPVFEDKTSCIELLRDLFRRFGGDIFVIVVDDGSVAAPLKVDDISSVGGQGVVLTLWRNVGHQSAIAAGLAYASTRMLEHQNVVVMDSDGEDCPGTVENLIENLQDDVDAVVAIRGSRNVSLNFRIFYFFYKFIFRVMTGQRINFGNFMALKSNAVQRLIYMRELGTHIAGSLLRSRLRIGSCRIDRGQRYSGKSKMNFFTLVLHGFKGLIVFAEDVLVRTGVFSLLVSSLSIVGIIGVITLKAFGFATPGWFSVALGILVLILLQTGALALITLLMTGVSRSKYSFNPSQYTDLIKNETYTLN